MSGSNSKKEPKMRRAAIVTSILFLSGCPAAWKTDPWLAARTILNGVTTALVIADGIFNQWYSGQADMEKANKTRATYQHVRQVVTDGLSVASQGVEIAKTMKQEPDISKLMVEVDKAWKELRKLLDDLTTPPPGAKTISPLKKSVDLLPKTLVLS
jgi:hypothetical protein